MKTSIKDQSDVARDPIFNGIADKRLAIEASEVGSREWD